MTRKVRKPTFNDWIKDEFVMKNWLVHELHKAGLAGTLSSNSSVKELTIHINDLAKRNQVSIEDYKQRWRKYKYDSTRKVLFAKIDNSTYNKLEALAEKKRISKTETITKLINNNYRSLSKDDKQKASKNQESNRTKNNFYALKLGTKNAELCKQNNNLKTVNDFLLSELLSAQQLIKEILESNSSKKMLPENRNRAITLLQDLAVVTDIAQYCEGEILQPYPVPEYTGS